MLLAVWAKVALFGQTHHRMPALGADRLEKQPALQAPVAEHYRRQPRRHGLSHQGDQTRQRRDPGPLPAQGQASKGELLDPGHAFYQQPRYITG